ncbi:MAG: hypothetical protein KatS3mg131_3086 [Candidatus Tectimicrobiota bacterium]|nr:MAG: hypothetical protein KatS3mg131_3086 [Candidatus Tectomicrobia bacterium]
MPCALTSARAGLRLTRRWWTPCTGAYLAQKEPGKQRWGDKNPRYVLHVPLLHALFPRAKFIHLIRDGRDVAVSHRQPPFNVHAVARAARLWKACVLQGHRHGLALGEAHYLEVRYEALCLSPRPVLARLCDFLGIPLEYERMLRFYADNAARQLIPPARHAWHRNTFVPLTAARIGVWRRELAPADVEAFEALAGDVLEKFGYAVGSGSG